MKFSSAAKQALKLLAIVIAASFLFAGGLAVSARLGAFEPDPSPAMALYGNGASRFVDIDGTRMHFRDEGQGPVLVLLHGSRGSLQQWDGWVKLLGSRFRIIRFDAQAHGLTGADARGDYSAERQLFLMQGLLDNLHVDRFALAGTSSGATIAVRYAAAHPERVDKLLLSTVPLRLPAAPNTSAFDRAIFWTHEKILGTQSTNLFWRHFLRSIVANPDFVTDDLVRRYRLLNGLPGQQERYRARIARWIKDGGAARDYALAAKVTAPTLIQWGGAGPVLPKEMFCEISAAFTATPVKLAVYPDLGHLLVLEAPERTARDALAFLDGAQVGERCESAAPAASIGPAARRSSSVLASSR